MIADRKARTVPQRVDCHSPLATPSGLSGLREVCHIRLTLSSCDVDRVADKATTAALKRVKLSKVFSTATTDSDGRDALNITVVIGSKGENAMSGDAALNVIVRIQRDLRASGEDRLAIVDFITEDELTLYGDP